MILALCGIAYAAAAERKPNILFIITDQQHAGMMSCAGNRWVNTKAMDSLARDGVRFEQAYCANPVCVPSRVAMITGRMPSAFGMETNQKVKIPAEVRGTSLGSVFREAGYETAYGGKVHVPHGIEVYGFDVISQDHRGGLSEACAEFLRRPHEFYFAPTGLVMFREGPRGCALRACHWLRSRYAFGALHPDPQTWNLELGTRIYGLRASR